MAQREKLLLTGGSGMVGRNILDHPLLATWEVLAPNSRELDLTDAHRVRDYLVQHQPGIVVHAAGQVGGILANITHPVAFLERNAAIGRNVIMAAYQAGVRRFLNLASTCMYPRAAVNPLREEMILRGELEPTNEGYALAKIMATRLCQYIRREDPSAHYKTLIPCNLFGRYDKFGGEESHLLPAIIDKIHFAKTHRAATVDIWGDGSARREFLYAGDLADAALKAATEIEKIPDLMNIGLGYDFTINEYYKTVADVIGWHGKFTHDLTRPVGMKQKLCSIERQTAWNWFPQTALRDAIARSYEYYLNEAIK